MKETKLLIAVVLFATLNVSAQYNLRNPKVAGKKIKFSKGAVLLGALTKYRTCFDVYYYDFSLDLSSKKNI